MILSYLVLRDVIVGASHMIDSLQDAHISFPHSPTI